MRRLKWQRVSHKISFAPPNIANGSFFTGVSNTTSTFSALQVAVVVNQRQDLDVLSSLVVETVR